MNVKKVGKSWAYDFYYEGERHRQGRFRTKREAQEAANKLRNQLSMGYKLNDDVPFVAYFERWLTVTKKGKVSEKSLMRYNNAIKVFEEKFGRMPINKLTRLMYQEMLNEYAEGKYLKPRSQGRAKSSVEKIHYCLREAIQDAHHEGLIFKDPTYNVTIKVVKQSKDEEDKFMSLDTFKRLKEYSMSSNELSYLCIYLLIVTGARFGEIQNLKIKDLDPKRNKIHIPGTKTVNSDRTIVVSKNDMKYIMDTISSRPINISGQIFDTGYNLISNQAVTKVMQRFLLKNKLGSYTLHSLRHTHCSSLIYKGVDIYYISKRLGHANVTITQNIYGHLMQEREDESDRMIINGAVDI